MCVIYIYCDKPRGRVINGKYVRAELLTGLSPLTGLRPEGGLQFTKWPPQKDYKPQQPEQCAKAWQPHPQQSWGVAGQYKKGQHRPGREEREEKVVRPWGVCYYCFVDF